MTDTGKRILFVCVENANRSQMAEAFARAHVPPSVEVFSAGSRPSGEVNPRAVAMMAERGLDLASHTSKDLAQVPPGGYAAVVTMGCGDECPLVGARIREDWDLPDPKALDDDGFRAVRDEIERRVLDLIARV